MRLFQSLAILLVVTLVTPIAHSADDPLSWPYFRGNRGNNGLSQGIGNISQPAVRAWRKLGGQTSPYKMRFDDFVHDERPEILIVELGQLFLKTTSNWVLWHSENLGISEIIGVHDLNRDGADEVITSISQPQAAIAIFSTKTGQLLWFFDSFGDGAISIRAEQPVVADLNADGFLDLVCSARANAPNVFAFSFAGGFAENPSDNLLWSYPRATYQQDVWYLAGDVDGDNKIEVVFLEHQYVTILAGESGAEQVRYSNVFPTYEHSFGPTFLANVDEDPESEIIAIGSISDFDLAITVLDASADSGEEIRWQYQWLPTDGKDLVAYGGSVVDIDDDGDLEVVVGIYNNVDDEITTVGTTAGQHDGLHLPDRWMIAIYDARNGTVEHHIPDVFLHGITKLHNDAPPVLFAQQAAPGSLNVAPFETILTYQFRHGSFHETVLANHASFLKMRSLGHPSKTDSSEILTKDLNADGTPEIFVTIDEDANGEADVVRSISLAADPPLQVSQMALEDWEAYSPIANYETATGSSDRLIWASNEGELHQLDESLTIKGKTPLHEFTPSMLSTNLNTDSAKEILAVRSSGLLVNLQLKWFGMNDIWSLQTDASTPWATGDIDGDGDQEILTSDHTSLINPKMLLLSKGGAPIWQHEFSDYGTRIAQAKFGDLNGDPILDVIALIKDLREPNADDLRLVGLSGVDGSELWNVPTDLNNIVIGPPQVAKINSDDIEDVVVIDSYQIEFYDGLDGTLIGNTPYSAWSYSNLLGDVDADHDDELILINRVASQGISLYEFNEPDPLWNIPQAYDAELAYYWPGLSTGSAGLNLIRPSPSGAISAYSPGGVLLWGPLWARQGLLLADDPGDLNAIKYVTVADIDGDGVEDALVGSQDGYLMAINTGDGTLTWSLRLYAPIGEPIVSDVDGDGLLEVVVGTQRGYLHVVDQAALFAPQNIRDINPAPLATTQSDHNLQPTGSLPTQSLTAEIPPPEDIDVTETRNVFGAAWDPVAGADGYYASVIDESGIMLHPWIDVGDTNSAVIETAPLPINATYKIVVKAYSNDGNHSSDNTSDGVSIQDEQPPSAVLTAEPTVFNPERDDTLITLQLADNTWLSRYELSVHSETDSIITAITSETYGLNLSDTVSWPNDYMDGTTVSDGTYDLWLTATDDNGNSATHSLEIVVDSVPPPAPSLGVEIITDGTATGQPSFSGVAEPHSAISVTVDGAVACNADASDDGAWQCIPTTQLTAGEYVAQAVADDSALNRSNLSGPVGFRVSDISEPIPSTESGPATVPGIAYDCGCQAVGAPAGPSFASLFTKLLVLWLD